MKLKIYRIFFTILIILALIVTIQIGIKYSRNYQYEKENEKVVEVFSREIGTLEEDVEMNGYKVIGIVKIPKIEIEYPILDIDTYNPEETKEPTIMEIYQ